MGKNTGIGVRFVAIVITLVAAIGVGGCDAVKGLFGKKEAEAKDEDVKKDESKGESDEDKGDGEDEPAKADAEEPKDKPAADTPAPEASSSAAPAGDTKVASYPEMKAAEGSFKLLKELNVFQGADEASTKLTALPAAAVVTMKQTYKEWSLVSFDKRDDVAEGWVHALPTAKDVFGPADEAAPAASPAPASEPAPPATPGPVGPNSKTGPWPSNGPGPCGCPKGNVHCELACARRRRR
jgi:hypothetical protein